MKEANLLIEKYLSRYLNLDGSTLYKKEKILKKHFIGFIKEYDLIDLTFIRFDEVVLREFIKNMKEKGYKDSYIKLVLKEIRNFINYIRKLGYDAKFDDEEFKVILKGIRKENINKKDIEYYTDEDIYLINQFLLGRLDNKPKPPIYFILVNFLLHSGLRISEALNLYPEDIVIKKYIEEDEILKQIENEDTRNLLQSKVNDEQIKIFLSTDNPSLYFHMLNQELKDKIIDVVKDLLEDKIKQKELFIVKVKKGKFGKDRIVPMLLIDKDMQFKALFKEYLALKLKESKRKQKPVKLFSYSISKKLKNDKSYILRDIENPKPSSIKSVFSRYSKLLKALGYDIDLKAHKFRKTYATRLAEEGMQAEEIKEILGHEDIKTTLKYYAKATEKARERRWLEFVK